MRRPGMEIFEEAPLAWWSSGMDSKDEILYLLGTKLERCLLRGVWLNVLDHSLASFLGEAER